MPHGVAFFYLAHPTGLKELYPFFPSCRMAAAMHDCDNDYSLFFKLIINREWEAVHYSTPDTPIDNRIKVWIVFNLIKGALDFVKKIMPEPFLLQLIPSSSLFKIYLCIRLDMHNIAHKRFLISCIASSALRPMLPSA